jgi:hypothetical protein
LAVLIKRMPDSQSEVQMVHYAQAYQAGFEVVEAESGADSSRLAASLRPTGSPETGSGVDANDFAAQCDWFVAAAFGLKVYAHGSFGGIADGYPR